MGYRSQGVWTGGSVSRRVAHAGVAAGLLLTLGPHHAHAVFIDDFNGPWFEPHWTTIPPPGDWRYDFFGQRLNVRQIAAKGSWPFDPVVWMIAPLGQTYIDPEVRIVFGFDGSPRARRIDAHFSPNARIALYQDASGTTTFLAAGFGIFEMRNLVGSGPFDVRMLRASAMTLVFVNGSELIRLPGVGGNQVRQVQLLFTGPRFAQLGPVYVDHVSVIPCLPTTCLLALGLLAGHRRRRALSPV